jgi:hypothetical protein
VPRIVEQAEKLYNAIVTQISREMCSAGSQLWKAYEFFSYTDYMVEHSHHASLRPAHHSYGA